MREIITVQLGNCGNNLGWKFWELISSEHKIDYGGRYYGSNKLESDLHEVYYVEGKCRLYGRAIAADIGSGIVAQSKQQMYGNLIKRQNFVYGKDLESVFFPRGYRTEGAALMPRLLNVARKEAEAADNLQGFQLVHSIGGGMGSGMAALLLENLSYEYPKNCLTTFTVFPSSMVSNSPIEAYNCLLSMPSLLENAHYSFCFDNTAVHNICVRDLLLPASSYQDLNHIIAHTMSGLTTCFRFPGQLNATLRKQFTNMVPFPSLHFFVPGFSPHTTSHKVPYTKLTIPQLVMRIFDKKNLLLNISLNSGQFLSAAAIFRGLMQRDVESLFRFNVAHHRELFLPWIADNVKAAICEIPSNGIDFSGTLLGNTTAIRHHFRMHCQKFDALRKRRSYLQWYFQDGMEESDFDEARNVVTDLMNNYKDCETIHKDDKNEVIFSDSIF